MPANAQSCPACDEDMRTLPELPWPGFAHIDHRPLYPAPLRLLVCDNCGLGGVIHPKGGPAPEQIYSEEKYVTRAAPVHYVRSPQTDELVSASQRQIDLFADLLPENPSILDIGCFDGRLLKQCRERIKGAKLVGYDVSHHNERFFDGDIAFVMGGLEKIDGAFDLIVMAHSMQYEPDLKTLFSHLRRLLKPEGYIFLQVPDVSLKPSGLLFADLHHHFTMASLRNAAILNGFQPTEVTDSGFRNDAVITATFSGDGEKPSPVDSQGIGSGVTRLHALADKIASLRNGGPWNILGTTIEAAFVHYLLSDQAAGFVDEAPSKQGTDFQGINVRHPRELGNDEKTLLPLGSGAIDSLARFQNTYYGEFALV